MVKATKKAAVAAKVDTKKAKARKAKKTATVEAVPAQCNFDFWNLANDIQQLSYKIDSAKDVIELLASSLSSEPESGTAWAVVDLLEMYSQKLEKLSDQVMEGHRLYGESQLSQILATWDSDDGWILEETN